MNLTSLVPLPYRILVGVMLVIAVFGAGVMHGMKLGEADLDAYRVAEQQATIRGMADAAKITGAWQARKDKALYDATIRAQNNSRAADAARAERDGLRDELADAHAKLAGASCSSVREYAATLDTVFGQCVERYQGVAREAQGHASDSLMYQQAWPRAKGE